MAVKKSLYQLLGVNEGAGAETIKAAFDGQLARLADAVSTEDRSTRAVLRDGYAILSDPVQRKAYDERLREERLRALSSGMEGDRPRPANARPMSGDATTLEMPQFATHHFYALAAIVIAGAIGAWVYLDHSRKVEAQRMEAARLATEEKRRADEDQRRQEQIELNRSRTEAMQKAALERQQAAEAERSRRQFMYEAQNQSSHAANEERRRAQEQRNAEYQRQREEQENVRRSQMQLERERRYLQELERNRPLKF